MTRSTTSAARSSISELSRTYAKDDSDLDPIRDDPAFAALVGREAPGLDETRPLLVVRDSVAGEFVCEALRADGIKCACVEVPSEFGRTSPLAGLAVGSPSSTDWAVVVSASDVERARAFLEEHPELLPDGVSALTVAGCS